MVGIYMQRCRVTENRRSTGVGRRLVDNSSGFWWDGRGVPSLLYLERRYRPCAGGRVFARTPAGLDVPWGELHDLVAVRSVYRDWRRSAAVVVHNKDLRCRPLFRG